MRTGASRRRLIFPLVRAGNLICLILLQAACPPPAVCGSSPPRVALEARRTWEFGEVHFSNDFPSGRLAACEQIGPGEFRAVVTPENQPINRSPWYAFKVWSERRQSILVCLTNTYSPLRGRPWLSREGTKWKRLDESAYTHSGTSQVATVRLKIGRRPVWVAAHEIIGLNELGKWIIATQNHVTAFLALQVKADFGEGFHALPT